MSLTRFSHFVGLVCLCLVAFLATGSFANLQAGEAEDLITSRITNPLRYQVIFEDFNSIPSVGLAVGAGSPIPPDQKIGWAVYGVGLGLSSNVNNLVGATLIGAGEAGQGNGTIQVRTGTAVNNETILAPPSRVGLAFPAYVTRLQSSRQNYVLAIRVSSWNANQTQFAGLDGFEGGVVAVDRAAPSLPRFYWNGATWSFRFGATNIPLSVTGGGPLVFRDLMASAQAGILKLYVDSVLVVTTTAPSTTSSEAYPAFGVKTKLAGNAATMGVDYLFWATERNPP